MTHPCDSKKLNKPWRTSDGPKKFAVCVKAPGRGKIRLLRFGDPDMEIKRDDPKKLKNFRARMRCDSKPPKKHEPRYWACKTWEKDKTVGDIVGEDTLNRTLLHLIESDPLGLARRQMIRDPDDPYAAQQHMLTKRRVGGRFKLGSILLNHKPEPIQLIVKIGEAEGRRLAIKIGRHAFVNERQLPGGLKPILLKNVDWRPSPDPNLRVDEPPLSRIADNIEKAAKNTNYGSIITNRMWKPLAKALSEI